MAELSNTLVTVKSNSGLQTETETQSETTDEEQNDKAYFPLLLCESTVKAIPPNLQTIVENLGSYGGSDSNKTDLLISIIYVLMIESGFIPKQCKDMFDDNNVDFHKGRLDAFTFLPEKWKSLENNSYNFQFILTPFIDATCKMSCVVVNQSLTVNLLVRSMRNYCIDLIINKYIAHEDIQPISAKFNNLNELSIDFKNQIALPAKHAILTVKGVPHAALEELPTEVMYKIFVQQETFDFLHLKATCKRMQDCAKFFEHELWKIYFKRDFPNCKVEDDQILDWGSRYKTEHILKQMLKRQAILRGRKRKTLFYDII